MFYIYLVVSLLFFALVVWFFCFVIYVKVGWGWALSFIFIFAEGGRKFVVMICLLIPLCMGICCVYLFVNPPSNVLQEDNTYSYYVHLFHRFITRPIFWHYKRSSETEGVFNFKFIFIVFVYYSFSSCIRIFCKWYMYTFILHSIDYKKTRFSCLLIHAYLAHWLAIFSPIYNRPFFKFKENVW